ncbi:MAG: 23S rRNA (pseudouridine(1915)-N(3))-methyltransferase RlmH [Oscillospiraceae bacterium]
MQNIQIICLGKQDTDYYRLAAAEYEKRLSAYCRLTVTELSPETVNDKKPSKALIEKALDKEGKAILSSVLKGANIVALCIEGKEISSEGLSEMLSTAAIGGNGDFAFIIGSSHGISQEVKKVAAHKLSMSKMTFPHQLARVMLTEQLYRAFSILNGSKYHK